jgi:carboxypeptidase family protein
MNVLSDHSPRWEPLLIVLMLLAAASSLIAQTPPPRDVYVTPQGSTRDRPPARTTGTAVVKGRVVDGVTGKPISRARVRLMGATGSRTALSDGNGGFTFANLAPGSFGVTADKSTYMGGRYPEGGTTLRARFTPNTVADGQTVEATIKLFHGGVIAGRVVDSYGDPLEYADVRAMFIPRGQSPSFRGSVQTNDLGEFRLARLAQGRYVLSITPRNLNVDEMFGPNAAVQVQPQVQLQPTSTYYPAAASLEQAQAIVVNRGETIAGIEVVLGEGVPTVVTGMVSSMEGALTNFNGNISVRLSASGPMSGPFVAGTGIRPDGSFRLPLQPGQYILEARVTPQTGPGEPYQPSREMMGMVPLTIGGNAVESIMVVVGKGATATGRVVFEGTTPPPAPPSGRNTRVPFYSDDVSTCRSGEATVAEDWTFKIQGLSGTCSTPPANIFGRWAVKSVKIGGVNVVDKPFTFELGHQYNNVEIVVTDKPPVIELLVAGDDGQPTREYVALAFPLDKATWRQGPRTIRTMVPRPSTASPIPMFPPGSTPSANGKVQDRITGFVPGEYYVITLDDIDAEDAFDPTVLEKLAQRATRVTLGSEGTVELALQRQKAEDILR